MLMRLVSLIFTPTSSTEDQVLLEAIDRNIAAAHDVADKADDVSRALANIREASEGLFA